MSVDYAKLAADAGGAEASGSAEAGKDYAALAKQHGGGMEEERAALDKDVTNEDYLYRGLPGVEVRIPHTGGVNQFLVSTGRGMVDLWAGGTQRVLGAVDKIAPRSPTVSSLVTGKDSSREAEYTKGQEEDLRVFSKMENEAPVISTLGRIAGQVAPTAVIPGGGAARGVQAIGRAVPGLSMLTKAGVGTDAAIQGGLLGFLNFAKEGDSVLANALTGAAVAGGVTKVAQKVAEFAAPTVRKGIDWVADKIGVGKSGLAEMAGTKTAAGADDVAAALEKEGIDFSTLPGKVRDTLVAQADDAAKAGAPVTPAELARVVRAQNLPGGEAQLTKGQMTQNRQQLRDEFNLRRTRVGASLDEQLVNQDKVLADSLDVIKLKTGGDTTAGREAEAGRKITAPLLDQLKTAQGNVDSLYKVADESGETLQKVDATPIIKWTEDNYAAMHSAPAMKSLVADLKKSGLVTFSEDGVATAGREPTVREVESLRQAMVKWGKADGASGAYMGEAKRVLDGMTEGKGGELYAKARAARIDLRNQFEDPGIINRLVSEKPGGDRALAFEDVFKKSVVDSSVDDLTTLRGQLLRPAEDVGTATAAGAERQAKAVDTRDAGVQAFKDLRAAALDYIKLGAVNNAKDEFSYAGLKRAVDTIGQEKLEVLFGKNTANQITQVVESAKDMKAVYNKSGVYNPGTASAGADWVINAIDHITGIVGLGKAGTYGRIFLRGGAQKIMDAIQEPATVAAASQPVAAAMKAGAEAKTDVYRRLMGMYAGRAGEAAGLAETAKSSAAQDDKSTGR